MRRLNGKWVVATLVALMAAMLPSSILAYDCSAPIARGEVGPVAEDGSFTLKVERVDFPQWLAGIKIYFRGGESYHWLQPNPFYVGQSVACMAEPSELRIAPHDCYADEYLPGVWTTTMSPISTPPKVSVTLDKAIDPTTSTLRRKATVTWDMGMATNAWSLRADLLSWKTADGATHSGGPLWTPTSISGKNGTDSFFFDNPSGAQQFTVSAKATSCIGTTTKEVSIDCVTCDEGASKDPVYFNDGNVRVVDFEPLPQIAGHSLTRTYNSDEQIIAPFGRGWTALFDRRLIINSDGAENILSIVTESNEVVTFRGTGGSYRQTWPESRTADATLSYSAGAGTYSHRAAGTNEVAVFRASDGRLIELRHVPTGHAALIAYDTNGLPLTITDSWTDVAWNITCDTTKRLVTSIEVSGRPDLVWNYAHDSSGNLLNVEGPDAATWRTYAYDDDRLIASNDPSGNLIESHTYDSDGYGISSVGPSDEIATIEYNVASSEPDERITRVTENNGNIVDYVLRPSGGSWRTVRVVGGCGSCGASNTTLARDVRGRVIRRQDARGYVTVYAYEDAGRLVSMQSAMKPVGCDPETSPTGCVQTPTDLSTVSLESTDATQTTDYEYEDSNWPDRPTAVVIPSIVATGESRREETDYDPASGDVTRRSVYGWVGEETAVERATAIRRYGEPLDPEDPTDPLAPAFDPGGSFSSSWLALPQPTSLRRSVDGPRTDVEDLTEWVYYPIDATVPALLRGRVAAVRNAAGHMTRFETYDVFGNATELADANGVTTELAFDGIGRVVTTTTKGVSGCDTGVDALCATDLTSTRSYATAVGPLLSEQRPGGGVTTYTYDSRGRIQTVSRGPAENDLRERFETSYDADTGKKSMERTLGYESGNWVEKRRDSFAYDDHSRLETLTHADSTSVAYAYDLDDRLVTIQDENHATPNTTYAYDPAGRLKSVSQALAGAPSGLVVTHYVYDQNGNLSSVTDPNGNVTNYLYDDFGQMLLQESPVTAETAYEYDNSGNLIQTTDANGATTVRTYDALGRACTATSSRTGLATETVTWTYDDATPERYGVGRLTSMEDPSGTTTYYYERRGLLLHEENDTTFKYETYSYDADGNRTKLGIAEYAFDFAGRPTGASAYGTPLFEGVKYLPFGPLTELTYGNGAVKTMDYDDRYMPTRNKLTLASTVIADYAYEHDDVGNITQIADAVDSDYTRDFAYDDLNRLITANTGAGLWGSGSYTYDAMGNMTSLSLGTSRSLAFTYIGTTPKVSTVNGTAGPTYDDAGNEAAEISARNLVALGAGHFTYDGRGIRVHEQLSHLEGSLPFSRTWSYAPDLHLLGFTETILNTTHSTSYVWLGGAPVGQLSDADYTGLIMEGDLSMFRYTFTDHLGTPLLQMIGNDVVWQAEYEPYGRIYEFRTGDFEDQRLRLPGQEAMDETASLDNVYNIHRWYRSGWGRYTQADPIGYPTYTYGASDPVGSTDPFGLYAIKNVIDEIATTNIAIQCGSLGSACTLGVYALLTCECSCTDGVYAAKPTLQIGGTLYYYPGNPKMLKTKPVDPTVISAKTSIQHEWSWHLDHAIAAVDPFIKELEQKSFQSKEECQGTCSSYREWVAYTFSSYLSYTQYVENKKQKPLPPY